MTGAVGLRAGGLGLVTLVAAAIAAVVVTRHGAGAATPPRAVVHPAAPWQTAVAGRTAPVGKGTRKSACGITIRAGTLGVAHPVLPCGVRVELELDGVRVTTPVVERGPTEPDREFDLTPALAAKLRLHGVRTIHWRIAR